jgi:hypothetical protein
VKIRLSDPDRERLGCPEWLDYDPNFLSVDDAEALEVAGGKYQDFIQRGPAGDRVRVWVALHRAGVTVTPFGALTFNLLGWQVQGDELGKAPSARSGSTTRSTSSKRATRSRTSKP